jgi:hypothetical protein
MSRKKSGASTTGFSRREFLLTVGAAPPTMSSGVCVRVTPQRLAVYTTKRRGIGKQYAVDGE